MAACVQQAGAREPGGRAADRRHRHAGVEEAPRSLGERLAAALVPQLRAGQDSSALSAGSSSASVMSGTIRTPPMLVIGSALSATVTISNGVPVKRPVRSSTSRWPNSQSATVSYKATCAIMDNMLS